MIEHFVWLLDMQIDICSLVDDDETFNIFLTKIEYRTWTQRECEKNDLFIFVLSSIDRWWKERERKRKKARNKKRMLIEPTGARKTPSSLVFVVRVVNSMCVCVCVLADKDVSFFSFAAFYSDQSSRRERSIGEWCILFFLCSSSTFSTNEKRAYLSLWSTERERNRAIYPVNCSERKKRREGKRKREVNSVSS